MSLRTQLIVVLVVLVLACVSFAVGRLYSHSLGLFIGVPALVASGWAFWGHLITIDADAPGNFFNPDVDEAASHVWRSSLMELFIKGVWFAIVGSLVWSGS